ncbi:transposase [Paenibacillus sp. NRS-1782]|uniref:transposase n=1 Tax=unclassified Paenibacillus TaxID=185978 RepID=UPI003D27276F
MSAEIEAYLKELFQEIAQEKEFEVVMMEVGEKDQIHVFASARPQIAPSYIVKMLNGISARKLFLRFPQLKKDYGVDTSGTAAFSLKPLVLSPNKP